MKGRGVGLITLMLPRSHSSVFNKISLFWIQTVKDKKDSAIFKGFSSV